MDPDSIGAKIGLAATITQILVEGWSKSFDQDQELAERLLHEVLDRDSHHPMARVMMGLLRRVQNRLGEAQAEVEMATILDRNNELALKQLGQILLFQGEPLAAIPHLEKAIRLNPRGPNLWSIQWPLAQCHLLLGDVDEAIELFRTACVASPRAYYLHLNLAGALGLRGDLDEARAALAEALNSGPRSTPLRVTARLLRGSPIHGIGRFATRHSMQVCAAPVSLMNDDHAPSQTRPVSAAISGNNSSVVRWRQ